MATRKVNLPTNIAERNVGEVSAFAQHILE